MILNLSNIREFFLLILRFHQLKSSTFCHTAVVIVVAFYEAGCSLLYFPKYVYIIGR